MLNFLNIRGTGGWFSKILNCFSKIEPPSSGEGEYNLLNKGGGDIYAKTI